MHPTTTTTILTKSYPPLVLKYMSSCFPIKKKQLLPSKKAWRGFASEIRYKLQKIKISKPIKHLNRTILLLRSSHRRSRSHYKRRSVLHRNRHSFAPVYVDQLFQPKLEPMVVDHVEQSPTEEVQMKKTATATSSSSSSLTPALYSVDMRAEMFIAKFKEDMRLQRQKSLEKYREMLARGM